ncbi:hypothetical protein PMAYCL1PPCAC_02524, partial [Pristionchus mayeri]
DMGDKTPESLSMDQYFDRLRSDHSPSVLARSGRTARCKPRSRLSHKSSTAETKRRLNFEENEEDRRRKLERQVEVVELSSSQSADEDNSEDSKQHTRLLQKGQSNKRRRSCSDCEESTESKKPVGNIVNRSPLHVVPFGDQNGNTNLNKPESRRTFGSRREVPDVLDEAMKRDSIDRARRVRAMEQFQKEVLNAGADWQDYRSGSEVDTDLDDELFDDFNHLKMK